MSPEADAPRTTDEEFLDEVFEHAVASCEDGSSLDLDALLGGHEHLRAEVETLVRTAHVVTPARNQALPVVPGYALLGEIGRGGMGVVYLARQAALGGRRVALKVLPSSSELSPRARDRFLAEAHAIAKLRHPSVVTVHDVVSGDGVLAYAMEWVDGASLGQVLDHLRARRRQHGPEDSATADEMFEDVRTFLGEGAALDAGNYTVFVCRIGIAIAHALGELHRAGLVHRDVKPTNILLRKDGAALLSDFGLVHATDGELTRSGQFSGTVAYASPEQLDGDPESLDPRSDVYALGTTLYHALAFHLPFDDRRGTTRRATTPSGMLRQMESGGATPLRAWNRRLPRDLETIVSKAIEPDPDRRYATADELADDLERMLQLQPIRARPSGWLGRTAKLVRRNRATAWGLGIGSVASLAIAAALVGYVFLVPRWVAEHMREARLALLDPAQANEIFVALFYGVPESDSAASSPIHETALTESVRHYDAALRWTPFDAALRAERDLVAGSVAEVAEPAAAQVEGPASLRAAGLRAFVRGEIELALEKWESYEATRAPHSEPDALVEAALGILYLVREEPARAYPRLREACQAFPDVGFLTTYLADAALQCGDVQHAERCLAAAAGMSRLDPLGAHERVRVAALVARGEFAEAERAFRAVGSPTPMLLDYARYLESRGRREESVDHYVRLASFAHGDRVVHECAGAVRRWWDDLDADSRCRQIRRAMDLAWSNSESVAARFRLALTAERCDPRPVDSNCDMLDWATFFAAVAGLHSSPPLQNQSLPDLARTLEVHDMSRWNEIQKRSPVLKELQLLAWRSPWPHEASRPVSALAESLARSPRNMAAAGMAFAFVGSVAAAQNCPNPPCFQGLGDLAGGNTSSFAQCLSSDGSAVGGGSATALTSPPYDYEACIWRSSTGWVSIGDLAGGLNAGYVAGLSADGNVATGWSSSSSGTQNPPREGYRWTLAGGMVGLGDLPGGIFESIPTGISDDGALIVSYGCNTNVPRAVTWTSATNWVIRDGVTSVYSLFEGVSRDGQWGSGFESVGGVANSWQASRWSDFLGWELIPTSAPRSTGYAVSDNGTVVGYADVSGTFDSQAFFWTGSGSAQLLADLPGGAATSAAYGILRDGTLIVGYGSSATGTEAVLWDESRSVHRIIDVLTGAGASIPFGWTLTNASEIVRNGNVITICGTGSNPLGQTEGWIARFEGYPTELFCFGDGSGTPCPCANHSPVGNDDGCLNSLGNGGRLRTTGTADISADTLVLLGSQMPDSFALYFQGSTLVAGGNGSVFGDGLRCSGSIIRLGTKQNAGNASQYPGGGDLSVSVRGMVVAPGGWRFYQAWYRNAAAFCTASTFNLTNAARVFWTM